MNDEHFDDALNNPYPGITDAVHEIRVEDVERTATETTTIGLRIKDGARLYTYQCARPVEIGDRVNIKLPSGVIVTTPVVEVHASPQLSDKWETKWAVVVQTRAEYEATLDQSSELGAMLGL